MIGAAALSLPTAFGLFVLGGAALSFVGSDVGAGWMVLLFTFGGVVALLVGGIRLLFGRSWLGLAVPAALLAALLTLGLFLGDPSVFGMLAWMAATATLALASLPTVRSWVADQQWARRYPGSPRPSGRS